jgi:hypothetical protein
MGRLNMHSKYLDFVLFLKVLGGGQGEDFFFFFIFPLFPFKFPMCSPRVFPIAPRFSPVWFAHSLGGPKGEGTPAFHRIFYFESLHSFNLFLQWANQIGSLQKKKKVGLVRHPQLINMKQNKYPNR